MNEASAPRDTARSRFDWLLHESFEVSILLKGAFALLEAVSGVLLWLIGPNAILDLIVWVTQGERAEDPGGWIAHIVPHLAQSFSVETQHFYALYFISHGLVKLVLVAGLLRGYRWAFPFALAVMTMFIAYQIHRYTETNGLGLIALTVFDVFVVTLIAREWWRVRNAPA